MEEHARNAKGQPYQTSAGKIIAIFYVEENQSSLMVGFATL